MHISWKTYKLSKAAEIKYGKDHKKLDSGNIPVYGTGGVMRYGDNFLYDQESILIPRKGSLGNIYFVNEPFWTVDTIFWTKINEEIAFPRFLFYKLKTLDFISMDVGSAIPSLTTSLLNKIELSLPTLPEQNAIASILSNIDDKIENNLAMNKTLEEMAMALYKHWFVDFGPFQDGKFVESELGIIPEGWEVKKLCDFAEIIMGQSPKSQYYNNEGIGLPFHQGVKDFSDRFPTDITNSTEGKRYASKNDILFSVRAPVGRINLAKNKIILGRGLAAISNKENYSFLLYMLKNMFQKEDIIGSGTVYNSVNKKELQSLKFLIPDKSTLKSFKRKISPLDEMYLNNYIENQTLKAQRDALLPKLVSGEVRVKGFE